MVMTRSRLFLLVLVALCSVLFLGCTAADSPNTVVVDGQGESSIPQETSNWKATELTDVVSGERFKISDFAGKTVLMESFAVWCPLCLKQQQQMAKTVGDNIVHVSLDTDPNEDSAQVKAHATQNNFEWYFAISPPTFTQELINEFGVGVVSAPSAPVIMICPDQSTRMLRRGVKSSEKLFSEIAAGC